MLILDTVLNAFTQLKQIIILVISSIYLVPDTVLLLHTNSIISHNNLTVKKLLSPLSRWWNWHREGKKKKIGLPAPLQLKIYGTRKIINQFLKDFFKRAMELGFKFRPPAFDFLTMIPFFLSPDGYSVSICWMKDHIHVTDAETQPLAKAPQLVGPARVQIENCLITNYHHHSL